jgi:hypothetical protein
MSVPVELRVPNKTLVAVRKALRMSQSEFAAAIRHAGTAAGEPNTCNKRLVQKWEAGEHTICRPNYRRALQSVTRTPYEQLGFAGAPVNAVATALAQISESMHSQVRPAGASPAEPATRLRYALELPGQADAETVALADASTRHLFDLEHHHPARLLAPEVAQHTREIAALLSGTRREQLRRQLAATGGQCAALAGWLAFDQGQAQAAAAFWESALAAARFAADGGLLACTLTYHSYLAEERGDVTGAWHLARQAMTQGGTAPRAQAWSAARAAQLAASLGDTALARSDLELALSLFEDLPPVTEDTLSPPWARFFDRCALASMAASVYARIDDQRTAHAMTDLALRHLGAERTKTRALAMAEAACIIVQGGSLDRVAELASKAAELTERLEYTPARRALRSLVPLLTPHRTHPSIRTLMKWLGP